METYKDYSLENFQGTQVGYGAIERFAKGESLRHNDFNRKRQLRGYIVIESGGYERFFDRKRDAKAWINRQAQTDSD